MVIGSVSKTSLEIKPESLTSFGSRPSASCFMAKSSATKPALPLGQSLVRGCRDTRRTRKKTCHWADEFPESQWPSPAATTVANVLTIYRNHTISTGHCGTFHLSRSYYQYQCVVFLCRLAFTLESMCHLICFNSDQ